MEWRLYESEVKYVNNVWDTYNIIILQTTTNYVLEVISWAWRSSHSWPSRLLRSINNNVFLIENVVVRSENQTLEQIPPKKISSVFF